MTAIAASTRSDSRMRERTCLAHSKETCRQTRYVFTVALPRHVHTHQEVGGLEWGLIQRREAGPRPGVAAVHRRVPVCQGCPGQHQACPQLSLSLCAYVLIDKPGHQWRA